MRVRSRGRREGRCARGAARTLAALVLALTLGAAPPGAAQGPDAPVADAAQRGDVETVRSLLREGADVNASQGDGMTALHWAAERGDAELAGILLYAGADVAAGTRIGRYTPLHLAGRNARGAVVRLLLEAGADPMARTTNSGATPVHLAAAAGDPEILRAMLEHGAEPEVTEGAWDQTPLIFAAANDRVEAIRLLLEAGADPNRAARTVDVREWAEADQVAAERLNEALEEFRAREGGGPGWQPSPSQVQAAVQLSREIQARWPDVPTGDDEGDEEEEAEEEASERPLSYAEQVEKWGGLTPLHHAVRQGHTRATAALLEGGADIDAASGDGTTPLMMAALNGHWDLAMVLLERGADPKLATVAGATPLYAVIERQWEPKASYSHPTVYQQQETTHLEMMEALLEAGADPDARLNRHLWYMEYTFSVLGGSGIYVKGATPFWRAAYALDVEAMRLLTEHGADPRVATMKPAERRRPPDDPEEEEEEEGEGPPVGEEAEAAEGQEAPSEEVETGEEEAAEEGEWDEEEEDEDLSGLPPVPTGGPAIFPIHAASGVGYGQSFAANAHRHTGRWMEAVRFLVEETGADVNQRDANGYTPLHHAASRGDNEMIRYLVEHGADVTALSRSGQTTADMANGPVQRVQPYPSTIALLEALGSMNNHNCLSC